MKAMVQPAPTCGTIAAAGVAAELASREVSRPGEFHPQPLTDPYVNLSVHTARHSLAPASCENKPSLEVEAPPGLPVGQVLR